MVDGLDPIPVSDVTFKFEPKVTINTDDVDPALPVMCRVDEMLTAYHEIRHAGEQMNVSLRAMRPILGELDRIAKIDPVRLKQERGFIHYRRTYLKRGFRQRWIAKRRSRAYR